MQKVFNSARKFVQIIYLVLIMLQLCKCQTIIGLNCTFKQGSQMNCRDYCSTYFKTEPQLAWYNTTSQQCEPLRICSWPLNYYNYPTNQCYTDNTMKQVAASQYPASLTRQGVATFYIDNICVNGEAESGNFNDAPCYCYQLWRDSGTVDMNGYPYKCDQVIKPQQWKGYYINNLIIGHNSTVLMYGQYTPQQLQVVYQQLLSQQLTQTQNFISKYENPMLAMIYKQLPQQSIIREDEMVWLILTVSVVYVVFAFSYVRQQGQIIKVTRKEFVKRIQQIINDRNAIQGVV